jgi:DNA-binding CsgD family transcriptional regulator
LDRTLILVKPDAFARGLTGELIARFERKGLRIVALKAMRLERELAERGPAALHERLAGLVADPEERARHLALAAAGPDEAIARALDEAAGRARARGAWEAGAELLERARSLTPPARSNEAAKRAVLAAEHHVRAGDRGRARALLEEVLERALPRALQAQALRLLAEISSHDENFAEAERLFTAALDCADEPGSAGAIELGLSYVQSNLMDFGHARAHAHRALERADAAGDRSLAGQALAHCAMMNFLCGGGVDWSAVERSLRMEDGDATVPLPGRPSTLAAFLLLYVGRHAEARRRLQAVCAGARERGDESDLAFLLLWLSWLETRSGDLARAGELADEAASIAVLTGSPSMHAWALTQQAYVHAHRGATEEVRRCCAEAAAPVRRSGNRLPGIWIAASTALLELSRGDHAAAWRACEQLTAAVEAAGVGEPVVAFFLPDALEALIALGRLDRAEALLEAFEASARRLDRVWALATGGRCRGLLLAAHGDLDAATAALQRALDEHRRLDMPFEHARTLLADGVVERRARRRACAKASFEQALAMFEGVGATLWAARARAELERVGLRRSTTGDLTAAERRVAQLAAQGLTNREVAASLFLSPKTVDANLARVYRKLGIGSRAQLGARMAGPVQA